MHRIPLPHLHARLADLCAFLNTYHPLISTRMKRDQTYAVSAELGMRDRTG